MMIDTRSPKIKIEFTTVNNNKFELVAQDLKGDFKSLKINKNLNDVAGTFQITLIARKNLQDVLDKFNIGLMKEIGLSQNKQLTAYHLFRPMTLVDIYINEKEVMIGIIDRCKKSTSITEIGVPSNSFTIMGRDLGALLIDNKIWYDKNTAGVERGNFILGQGYDFIKEIKNFNASEIMKEVYRIWFTNVLEKTTPNGVGEFMFSDKDSIRDKITCSSKPYGGISDFNYADLLILDFEAWNFEGNIFQFLKSFSTPPFNELFVETGDRYIRLNTNEAPKSTFLQKGKAHIVFRPAPFDDLDISFPPTGITGLLAIGQLQSHIITDEDVVDKNIEIGRNNIKSWYIVSPMSKLVSLTQSSYYVSPEYDDRALKRYGHNPMEVAIDSLSGSVAADATYKSIAENYQKKLRYWFSNADMYLTGTFKIKGNEEIRIGQRLVYEPTDSGKIEEPFQEGYYYIIGVSHDYIFGSKFTTTLTVDRGVSKELESEMKINLAKVK